VCWAALVAAAVFGALAPARAGASPPRSASPHAHWIASEGASDSPSRAPGVGAPEPTIKTTTAVDGKVGATVPDPPADVMGTPSNSTLVHADQLYMTKIDSNGNTWNQWAKVDPSKTDTGGIGEEGGYGQESTRPLLNPNTATAAGRFLDPVTARVLSLRLTHLGSAGLLTLSSGNGTRTLGGRVIPTAIRVRSTVRVRSTMVPARR
jgi:hypothetical protein